MNACVIKRNVLYLKLQIDKMYIILLVFLFEYTHNTKGDFPVDMTRHTFHGNLIVFPVCLGKRCADQTRDSYQIKPVKANYTDNNLSLPPRLPAPLQYSVQQKAQTGKNVEGGIHRGPKKCIPIEPVLFLLGNQSCFSQSKKKRIKKTVSFCVDIFSVHY